MSGKPQKQKWDNFAKKIAKNRLGPRAKSDETGSSDFLTVQRLSASVEGKCQKYTRIGPLTMVPRYGSEPTLDNIKESCKRDFEVANLECDVLAGERGPSYTEASQIKSWKVIHVRFVEPGVLPGTASTSSDVRVSKHEASHSLSESGAAKRSKSEFRGNTPTPMQSRVVSLMSQRNAEARYIDKAQQRSSHYASRGF